MKKILIGTHNKGKFKEITYLLSKKYKKISPDTLKIPSPKETSKTFNGNSKLKANFFSKFVDYPVISDDSGLCIKSLKNEPGIFSARLAKRKGSFLKAMKFILKKMITKVGKIQGTIAQKMSGKNGFGYDPIFIPKRYKITFGQMIYSKKLKIDHRHIAFQKLKKKIKIL